MNDKELLELAAKAHGSLHYEDGLGWIVVESDGSRGKWWNPLTDDGDALRLAVRLRIAISISGVCIYARASNIDISQIVETDKYAATRLAILRCAAEIGRQMQECNP